MNKKFKELKINKATGNYQFDNILISALANSFRTEFLNGSMQLLGRYSNNFKKSIWYPCCISQEKSINCFIKNHIKENNNVLYLINVRIEDKEYSQIEVEELYR